MPENEPKPQPPQPPHPAATFTLIELNEWLGAKTEQDAFEIWKRSYIGNSLAYRHLTPQQLRNRYQCDPRVRHYWNETAQGRAHKAILTLVGKIKLYSNPRLLLWRLSFSYRYTVAEVSCQFKSVFQIINQLFKKL